MLSAIIFSFSAVVYAQVVVQDDKGRSALLIPVGGFLGINTAEGSGEVAYFRLLSDRTFFGGVSVKAKSTDGVTALFGSGALRPGASVTTTFGLKSSDIAFAGRFSRGVSEAGLIDSSKRPLPTFGKRTLYTWDDGVQVHWFATEHFGIAIAAGRRRVNNYDYLSKVSMETVATSVDSATRTTVELRQVKDGRLGKVTEEALTYIDADAIYVPGERLSATSLRLFVRSFPERTDASPQRNSVGFDIGFHKKGGDPIADRLTAFVFQINEARAGDKNTDLGHRIGISVVANLLPILGALSSAIPKP